MGVHMPPSPMPYQASRRGGRSRPRPQVPDRHRRSGGRGATARQPTTCGSARVLIGMAMPCPSTPDVGWAPADQHRTSPIPVQDPPSGNRLKGGSAGWGLETEDRVVCGEYLALLDYKLDRREELERKVEALIVEPAYREAVGCLCGLKVIPRIVPARSISFRVTDDRRRSRRIGPVSGASVQADGRGARRCTSGARFEVSWPGSASELEHEARVVRHRAPLGSLTGK